MITPAFAQAAQGAAEPNFLFQLLPFILIFGIIYFLILRPQKKRMEDHRKMVEGVRRGDTVVTSGGIVGKVSKVLEGTDEIEVEIADNVKVKVVKTTLSSVRSKSEPVPNTSGDTKTS